VCVELSLLVLVPVDGGVPRRTHVEERLPLLAPGAFLLSSSTIVRLKEGRSTEVIPDMVATNMMQTDRSDVWFNGSGVLRVPFGSLAQPRAHDEPLDSVAFGTADGMASTQGSSGYPNSAITPDGKFWVATVQGIAMLDLPRLPRTERKPTIYMEEITVGREQQPPGLQLVLSPGPHHVDLRFDAVEISSPEKIKLQYRLDGVDSEWLDAGPAAHAVYSNIPSGMHAFHMRARNRDGIWERVGITYLIVQQPYFYQSTWFLLAAMAAGLLLFGGLYRLRLRQATARLNARLEERLAERTRMARELHDTFLQTIQGSKLVVDDALEASTDLARMRRAMEQLSVWLGRATQEGRAALNALRTATTQTNDLAGALRRLTEDNLTPSSMAVTFFVVGGPREMHPIVRDEVYRIGYEAIHNARTHSGASRLEVELRYTNDLALRVNDNGTGIDPAIAVSGKDGHFGLQGMRERAARIGGKLTLGSSSSYGTEIKVLVPGGIIFRNAAPAPRSIVARIKMLFRSRDHQSHLD